MEGKTVSIPAPVGGLNARDSLAEMPPTDAIKMDNWDPNTTNVSLRLGAQYQSTGYPGWVETLMAYNSPAGVNKLFAASSGNIYDATSVGAVGAAVVTGNSSNRWNYTTIGTAGGYFMPCVNGTDFMQVYNGSTWQQVTGVSAPIAITGVATNTLRFVAQWKQRLYFIQNNTLGFWYLGVSSIGGAANYFDLSAQFKLGGYLVAIAPWSAGSASSPQDYIAFLSSQGEVVVYQGFDPTLVGLFQLAMRFRVGTPVGSRPTTQIGDDIGVVSTDGLYLLREAMSTNQSDPRAALSYKIEQSINQDAGTYGANFGWQVVCWPTGSKIIVNVPAITNSSQYQYVFNTISKAWSRYTGWNAACFEVFQGNIYFGGATYVAQCFTGNNDFGVSITGDLKPAFSYFKTPGQNKQWTLVRPVWGSDDAFSTAYTLNYNFSDKTPAYPISFPTYTSKATWNVSSWNTTAWFSGSATYTQFKAVSGIGYNASCRIQAASQRANLALYSIDYVFKPAGII